MRANMHDDKNRRRTDNRQSRDDAPEGSSPPAEVAMTTMATITSLANAQAWMMSLLGLLMQPERACNPALCDTAMPILPLLNKEFP